MAAAFSQNAERSSSRVIKPPGGGHSDIFGLYDNTEPKHHVKHNQPKSQIGEVFAYDNDKKTETDNGKEENEKDNEVEKEVEEKKNGTNENEAPKPNPPQRIRVPPGGFSSGLW